MATDKKISTLVDRQVPEFVVEEGPRFVEFLKAYYEFLEQSNNSIDMSKNILNYRDVDKTLDDFLQYFRYEFMQKIPENVKTDKRLLTKYIRDVYETKGAENAFKFLFRTLYDDEISIYYPKDYILIASDGRWVQENSVRIQTPETGDISNFLENVIEGKTSGAKGFVKRSKKTTENGIEVFELFLENISGNFQSGETVVTLTGNNSSTIISTTGPISDLNIVNSGAFHSKGDVLDFRSVSGSGANGSVLETSDGESVQFRIKDGGSGYANGEIYYVPGGSGKGASFIINNISNTEIIAVNQDKIEPVKNVPLNESPTFTSNGANTSTVLSSFASSNVNSTLFSAFTFANTTVGTIDSISTLNYGYGYEVLPPDYTPVNDNIANLNKPDGEGGYKGKNAIIEPYRAPGSIISLKINEPGKEYRTVDPVTILNTTNGSTVNAIAVPEVTGIREYPGKYIDTRGFLSWDIVLQDSYFYQTFSYVIKSTQSFSKYKDIVKELLHPTGVKVFGEYSIESEADLVSVTSLNSLTKKIQTNIDATVPSVLTFTNTETVKRSTEAEFLSVIDNSTLSVKTNINVFVSANDTLTITDSNDINYYSNYTIGGWEPVSINSIGTRNTVISDYNRFTSYLSNNDTIIIEGATSNTYHTVTEVYTDTVLRIIPQYPNTGISNASFMYSI